LKTSTIMSGTIKYVNKKRAQGPLDFCFTKTLPYARKTTS
jgi:hypothetical protein